MEHLYNPKDFINQGDVMKRNLSFFPIPTINNTIKWLMH